MEIILIKKYKASITIESALSFSLVIFILFLILGPLFIVKTSCDVILKANEQANLLSYYKMIEYNIKENSIDEDRLLNNELNKEVSVDKKNDKDNNIKGFIKDSIENLLNISLAYYSLKGNKTNNNVFNNISMIIPNDISIYNEDTGIIKYDWTIIFKLPFNIFNVKNIHNRFALIKRAFIGAPDNRFEKDIENEDLEYVYVTRNAVNSHVYHISKTCVHLVKIIHKVRKSDISNLRNESGGKYYNCPHCMKEDEYIENVYITDFGDRYHLNSTCSYIKSTVIQMNIAEAKEKGYHPCNKTDKGKNEDET